MIIKLDEHEIAGARRDAEVIETFWQNQNKPNANGVSAPDRFLIGILGERALGRWLEFSGIEFEAVGVEVGRDRDDGGIDAIVPGVGTLDVKTSGDHRHRWLMMPATQLERAIETGSPDWFVAARRIDNGRIKVEGMIAARSLFRHARRHPACLERPGAPVGIPFSELSHRPEVAAAMMRKAQNESK